MDVVGQLPALVRSRPLFHCRKRLRFPRRVPFPPGRMNAIVGGPGRGKGVGVGGGGRRGAGEMHLHRGQPRGWAPGDRWGGSHSPADATAGSTGHPKPSTAALRRGSPRRGSPGPGQGRGATPVSPQRPAQPTGLSRPGLAPPRSLPRRCGAEVWWDQGQEGQ